MKADEKYAKLLALSVLYEKKEPERTERVKRITCCPKDVNVLLNYINDNDFKNWVKSVAHMLKT